MKRHPAKQVLFMLPALALLAVGSASVEAPQEQSAPQAEGEAQPECKHSRMRCDARIVLRGVDALLLRLLEAEATHGEDAGKARAKNREAKVEAKQLKEPKEQGTRALSGKGLAGARQIGGPRDGWWSSLAALNGKLYSIEWIDGFNLFDIQWTSDKGALLEFSPREGLIGANARQIGGPRDGRWSSLAALNGKMCAIKDVGGKFLWDTPRGALLEFSPREGLGGSSARGIGGGRDGDWRSLVALNGNLYAIRVGMNDVLSMGWQFFANLLYEIDGDEKGVLWDFLYGLRNAASKGVLWEFSPREGLGGASARQIGGSRRGAWYSLAALDGKLYAIDNKSDVLWEFSPREGLNGGSARQIGGPRDGWWSSLAALNGKLYAIDTDDESGVLWEID